MYFDILLNEEEFNDDIFIESGWSLFIQMHLNLVMNTY